MNIYLISQRQNNNYDTYDSAIVVAANEMDARCIHPCGKEVPRKDWQYTWCATPAKVDVKLLGKAAKGTQPGVICASFNAG